MNTEQRTEALIRRARELDATARRSKREAERHRQAARAAREQQAEIERQCADLGITVTYASPQSNGEGTSPWPKNLSSTSRR